MNLAETVLEKFHQKPSEASFSAIVSTVDNFRPEVASKVRSGVIIDSTGTKGHAICGDS